MGTTYHIKVVADQLPPDDLAQRIDKLLSNVDNAMSTYKSNSQLSRFNRLAVGQNIEISSDFAQVLQISKDIWAKSGGAFDPTLGPLVDLWGFGPNPSTNTAPSADQISLALQTIGFQYLVLDGKDLSAVAKGYAVDLVADMLEMMALPDYLVEVGGEVRVSGSNPDGEPWRIAIEQPQLMPSVNRIISLNNMAVATSGDYRNYFDQEGVRYSHILDSRTGLPIKHNLASVTVLSNSCAEADAWATAFLVMGAEESLQIAQRLNIAVYLLVKEGDTYKALSSEQFQLLSPQSSSEAVL
jgi:thiamine biosynthesis lipoprotein